MRKLIVFLSVLAVVAVGTTAAVATSGGFYHASLQPIPHDTVADGGSNLNGSSKMFLPGLRLTVSIHATGLSPNLPHAMHIHGVLGDRNVCPPASADVSGDGLISLEEGAPFYGPVQTSLTTSG